MSKRGWSESLKETKIGTNSTKILPMSSVYTRIRLRTLYIFQGFWKTRVIIVNDEMFFRAVTFITSVVRFAKAIWSAPLLLTRRSNWFCTCFWLDSKLTSLISLSCQSAELALEIPFSVSASRASILACKSCRKIDSRSVDVIGN